MRLNSTVLGLDRLIWIFGRSQISGQLQDVSPSRAPANRTSDHMAVRNGHFFPVDTEPAGISAFQWKAAPAASSFYIRPIGRRPRSWAPQPGFPIASVRGPSLHRHG